MWRDRKELSLQAIQGRKAHGQLLDQPMPWLCAFPHHLPTLIQEVLELYHSHSSSESSLGVFSLGDGSILYLALSPI